ncbi:MAG: hypothetical protein M0006_15090 [Magnetospirillum sp.]|nr:hypothetical protein [Magnetospirillum sp.]
MAFTVFGIALVATRVVTTAHYLSDALFGTYIGVISSFLVYHQFCRRGLFAKSSKRHISV